MRLAFKYLRIDAQIYGRVNTAAAPQNSAMDAHGWEPVNTNVDMEADTELRKFHRCRYSFPEQ